MAYAMPPLPKGEARGNETRDVFRGFFREVVFMPLLPIEKCVTICYTGFNYEKKE